MNSIVASTIQKYRMLNERENVIACVSGGADSMALLVVLMRLQKEGTFEKLYACHVNHHLRGDESDRDEAFVRSFCEKENIPCRVFHCDAAAWAKTEKQSVELCARQLRYGFFQEYAQAIGKDTKIATAHTLNDCAETALFNLARGTALKGLCGIPPVRGNIIRPLLETTRDKIEEFLQKNQVAYVEDSTNQSNDYSRNFIRHTIVPQFLQLNPSFYTAFSRTRSVLEGEQGYLERLAKEQYALLQENGYLQALAFTELEEPIQKRVAAFFLQQYNIGCEYSRIEQVRKVARDGGLARLTKEMEVGRADGKISIHPYTAKTTCNEQLLKPEKKVAFGNRIFQLKLIKKEINEKFNFFSKNLLNISFDYDKIKGNLFIRQRHPGDSVYLANRGVTKSLKKLFNEEKVPLWQRDDIPIVCDESGIVLVYGLGVRATVFPGRQTQNLAVLYCVEDSLQGDEKDKFYKEMVD